MSPQPALSSQEKRGVPRCELCGIAHQSAGVWPADGGSGTVSPFESLRWNMEVQAATAGSPPSTPEPHDVFPHGKRGFARVLKAQAASDRQLGLGMLNKALQQDPCTA